MTIKIDQSFCLTTITLSSGDYQNLEWGSLVQPWKVRIEVSEVVKGSFNLGFTKAESYAASIDMKCVQEHWFSLVNAVRRLA